MIRLVGGVFVDLVVLDEAVDAERGNDAYGRDDDNLDKLAHKSLLRVGCEFKIPFF